MGSIRAPLCPGARGGGLPGELTNIFTRKPVKIHGFGGLRRSDVAIQGRRSIRLGVKPIDGLRELGGYGEHRLGRGGARRGCRSDAGVDSPATRSGRTSTRPSRSGVMVHTTKRPYAAREARHRFSSDFSTRNVPNREVIGSRAAVRAASKLSNKSLEEGKLVRKESHSQIPRRVARRPAVGEARAPRHPTRRPLRN